jgi:hypothetical protein
MIVWIIMSGMLWLAGEVDPSTDTDQDVLKRAETIFQLGVDSRGTPDDLKYFEEAAALYDLLRRRGVGNSALYLNQGNADLLAGDWPQAILANRRGLRMDPNNLQMRANLAYARDQVVYSSVDDFARPAENFWPPWLPRLTPGFTVWLTFIFYILAWIALVWRWTIPTDVGTWAVWVGAGGTFLFAFVFMVQMRSEKSESEYPLVVIAEDLTYLQKGNHSLYPRAYETALNRGVEARLIQNRGGWLQIELAGGQIGWIPSGNALVDLN